MSAAEPSFNVLHIDNHLLVVDKPFGMLAQADRTGDPDLVSLAQQYLKKRFDRPGNVFVGLVQRLDRPASGVMVLARTSKAAARLSEQFRGRDVEKRYLALVDGRLVGEGTRVEWLVKGEKGTVRSVPEGSTDAKRAEMRWRAVSMEGQTTLIDVQLITGRPHQARVQLAGLGAPILGDRRYGSSATFADGKAIALHSYKVRVKHPTLPDVLAFTAAPSGPWAGRYLAAVSELIETARLPESR